MSKIPFLILLPIYYLYDFIIDPITKFFSKNIGLLLIIIFYIYIIFDILTYNIVKIELVFLFLFFTIIYLLYKFSEYFDRNNRNYNGYYRKNERDYYDEEWFNSFFIDKKTPKYSDSEIMNKKKKIRKNLQNKKLL